MLNAKVISLKDANELTAKFTQEQVELLVMLKANPNNAIQIAAINRAEGDKIRRVVERFNNHGQAMSGNQFVVRSGPQCVVITQEPIQVVKNRHPVGSNGKRSF